MCKNWGQKGVPKHGQSEIARLRHFLPRRHFFAFFGVFFSALWSSLGASWAALGFLEGLLGGLWTQKRVKTLCFLRFLKRLFEAPDGSLGLILVSLVNLFWILCKSAGPIWVPKLDFNLFYHFLRNAETQFGTQFGIRAAQEGQDEPKRTIRRFKEPKTFISKNLKKPCVF